MTRFRPQDLNGLAVMAACHAAKPLRKKKGERDTEFVKRIVCAYLNADAAWLEKRYTEIKAEHREAVYGPIKE